MLLIWDSSNTPLANAKQLINLPVNFICEEIVKRRIERTKRSKCSHWSARCCAASHRTPPEPSPSTTFLSPYKYWISAFGWFNFQQTHLRIWTGTTWDGKTNTEKARAPPGPLLPVLGEAAGAAHVQLGWDFTVCVMHSLLQCSHTLIHPSRGACAQQAASSSWATGMCGSAADIYCPVVMGAGLDCDSPIRFQLPTHFKAL